MDLNLTLGAILICFATIVTPLLVARQSFRRQDEVAARLEKASLKTNTKLDVIHTLVNSNMTAAMQSELDAITRELAMMLEVIELKKANGLEPSKKALAALDTTQSKLTELTNQLEDRRKSTILADKQLEEAV